MVKGHLNATRETVLGSAEGYSKRLWYDGRSGASLYDYAEQFEKAWSEKYGPQQNRKNLIKSKIALNI